MATRKIIEIDREKCDGCGLCTTACAEGALEIDGEGKAVLVREIFCDGLGACLDVCPRGALKVSERESEEYDSQAAYEHVLKTRGSEAASQVHGLGRARGPSLTAGCPGSLAREIPAAAESDGRPEGSQASRLSQWPIQLHLISPLAPYFRCCDLLIAADCTAFALGGFHQDLLKGRKLVIACPKLDETAGYVEKLVELIRQNDPRSITVAIMTVPCCSGLERLVGKAVELSGKPREIGKVVIDIEGKIVEA